MAEKTSYGTIFKTTFLFGFVQVFKAVVSILKNKIAAVLIGPEGMGILGIYQSVISMIQTGAGLGVNQSAVRDVSEANASGNTNIISKIISVVNKVILYTGLLGCVVTLCLSYWLSDWTFEDNTHIISYCILSLAIALNIIDETKQAILKGMRQLRVLAKAGMIGSAAGLFATAPLYYFFGKDGIVPALLIASIVAVLVSSHYVEKIGYTKIDISFKETMLSGSPMIKMGMALMAITFLQYLVALIVNVFIRSKGGLTDVGLYSAGNTIINSYFGVIITALMTDYYPRIAAVNNDNAAIQEELNRQSLVTLVLTCPMFVLFMTLQSFFIQLLYTEGFLPAVEFMQWGIYFTLITIVSNQVDMILIAKYQSKIMLAISLAVRAFQVLLSIVLYSLMGLKGLGIAYLVLGVLHMVIMCSVVYHLYAIRFTQQFVKLALFVLGFAVCSSFVQAFMSGISYYVITALLLMMSLFFSLYVSKKQIGIDFLSMVKGKIIKNKK